MPDNVTIPAIGTGDTLPVIATDQVATVHYQRVKLTDGTADSTAAIPGDATNGLRVHSTISQPTATATLASVSSSASSVTLQAANSARKGWFCFNNSNAVVYVKFGTTASSSSFTVKLSAGGYYELPTPPYTGIITGIWASANGAALVTEV